MLKHKYDRDFLEKFLIEEGVEILIVYEDKFYPLGGIPKGWIKAGDWKIKNNLVCGSDTVSFFSRKEGYTYLLKSLRDFSDKLPKDVIQKGKYLE